MNKKAQINEEIIKKEIESDLKIRRKHEKIREIAITVLGTVSIIGSIISLFFLLQVEITGSVIGPARNNIYGLMFIIIFLFIWTIIVLLWNKKKKL
jgi:hypothetical protein